MTKQKPDVTKTYLFPTFSRADNEIARLYAGLQGARGNSAVPKAYISSLTAAFDMTSVPRLHITARNHDAIAEALQGLTKKRIVVRDGIFDAPRLRAA